MRHLWVTREVDAPATDVWDLLVDTGRWPDWGPTVRAASIDGDPVSRVIGPGTTGTVTTTVGVTLHFEVSEFEPGRMWGWKVGGVDATRHSVTALGADRCRVGFGVPWPVAPYLGVCLVAVNRIRGLVGREGRAP